MAYDSDKRRENNKNCDVHRWPDGDRSRLLRSIGTIAHQFCNNCLAVKISWISDELVDGVWIKVYDEKIVEPDLKVSK